MYYFYSSQKKALLYDLLNVIVIASLFILVKLSARRKVIFNDMRVSRIISNIPGYLGFKREDSQPQSFPPEAEVHGGRIYKDWFIRTDYDPEFLKLIEDYYKEENNWHEGDFDWDQNVKQNLVSWNEKLEHNDPDEFLRIARECISLVSNYREDKRARLNTEGLPPKNSPELAELKEAIADAQHFWGLRGLSRHMGAVETVAVAPLNLIPQVLRRHPEIQECGVLVCADECRHGRVARRYLLEKVGGQMYVYEDMVDEMETFLKWGRYLPGTTVFAGLLIEVVGNSYFQFFAKRVPDPLLSDICSTITTYDEQRHISFFQRLYEMLHDPDKKSWIGAHFERFRNNEGIKRIGNMLYGEQARPDHYLMKALRVFGMSRNELFDRIEGDLTERLGQVNIKLNPTLFPTFRKTAGLQEVST